VNNPQKFSIIVHSTNGKVNSLYASEANFLLHSRDVSAHFLIGKDGRITQYFDDIAKYRAWHTGAVRDPIFNNNNSIGIECHYTPGETKDLPLMQAALTDLVQWLLANYIIADIQTHRNVAIPVGRKIDPSHISDVDFYIWRTRMLNNKTVLIRSGASVPLEKLVTVLEARKVKDAVTIAAAYTTLGAITGIGNVYPLAQAIHETGWFTSERWVKARNPAGLGATNDGAWGSSFSSIAAGVAAQYAHLLAYCTVPTDNNLLQENLAISSPRYATMVARYRRGNAKYWTDLNGKWAFPGTTYGEKILEIGKIFL
jgi:N-acetylmuramoyl-L-alanine amidase/Mannosyl-glycoprotein endo-beta-N-acetylglucosaminidase